MDPLKVAAILRCGLKLEQLVEPTENLYSKFPKEVIEYHYKATKDFYDDALCEVKEQMRKIQIQGISHAELLTIDISGLEPYVHTMASKAAITFLGHLKAEKKLLLEQLRKEDDLDEKTRTWGDKITRVVTAPSPKIQPRRDQTNRIVACENRVLRTAEKVGATLQRAEENRVKTLEQKQAAAKALLDNIDKAKAKREKVNEAEDRLREAQAQALDRERQTQLPIVYQHFEPVLPLVAAVSPGKITYKSKFYKDYDKAARAQRQYEHCLKRTGIIQKKHEEMLEDEVQLQIISSAELDVLKQKPRSPPVRSSLATKRKNMKDIHTIVAKATVEKGLQLEQKLNTEAEHHEKLIELTKEQRKQQFQQRKEEVEIKQKQMAEAAANKEQRQRTRSRQREIRDIQRVQRMMINEKIERNMKEIDYHRKQIWANQDTKRVDNTNAIRKEIKIVQQLVTQLMPDQLL